jgi:hypothetical protein
VGPERILTLANGAGATYDDRTRIVYTKVRPVLKIADFLAATPVAVMRLRLLDGNYAGPLIKVRRVDTSATIDIYPTSTGALDTAAAPSPRSTTSPAQAATPRRP